MIACTMFLSLVHIYTTKGKLEEANYEETGDSFQ
jgi:hypothetical protein